MPRPREALTFFIDDCFGSHELINALRAKGIAATTLLEQVRNGILKEHDRNVDDDVWIAIVAAKGWIILSSDKRARSLFSQVIFSAKAACFFFTGTKATGAQQAELICDILPNIEKRCHQYSRPLIGKITPSGQLL